jgi:16S rRNA (guanine(966)-N(2))-methyltransferase RsmD
MFSSKTAADELRPTSAKVREAIFDILQNEIKGAVFLDLYAGTGAVGIEALSRGAEQVVLVERNKERARAIGQYIGQADVEDRVDVYVQNAEVFLKRACAAGALFDIIFADPPYASDEINKVLVLLNKHNVLGEGGCLIIEHASKSRLPDDTGPFKFKRNYRYGDTMLTLYKKVK